MMNISDIWESCRLPCSISIIDYMLDYIISWKFEVSHDILHLLKSISCKTVSRIFFFTSPIRHGGPLYF